jgi:hypothetical protein
MDEAHEPVHAGGQGLCRQARAGRHAGGQEDVSVRALRHRLEAQQLVDLGNAATAKRGHLANVWNSPPRFRAVIVPPASSFRCAGLKRHAGASPLVIS